MIVSSCEVVGQLYFYFVLDSFFLRGGFSFVFGLEEVFIKFEVDLYLNVVFFY